jgi:hypothetical protein
MSHAHRKLSCESCSGVMCCGYAASKAWSAGRAASYCALTCYRRPAQ